MRQPTVRPSGEPARKCTFLLPLPLIERLRESAEHSRRAVYAELTVILEQHFAAKANEQTGKVA